MTPSPWLFAFLKQWEKFRPTAFKPTPNDVWTIAWGHTKGVKEGDTCTMDQGEVWLQEDAADAVANVNGHVHVTLTQAQFDAMCSLCFNIGDANYDGSTLLIKLNASDYAGAAAQFPSWRFQKHLPLKGLLERRLAEQAHFLGH